MAETAEMKKLIEANKRKERERRKNKTKSKKVKKDSLGLSEKEKQIPSKFDKKVTPKTRAQRGIGDMSMGGRRDLGKGTGRAGENDTTVGKSTGSQVKRKTKTTYADHKSPQQLKALGGYMKARRTGSDMQGRNNTKNPLAIDVRKPKMKLDQSQVADMKGLANKLLGDKPKDKAKPKKDSQSFGQAFKAAKSSGAKVFTWKGKQYSTKTKDDAKKKDSPSKKKTFKDGWKSGQVAGGKRPTGRRRR